MEHSCPFFGPTDRPIHYFIERALTNFEMRYTLSLFRFDLGDLQEALNPPESHGAIFMDNLPQKRPKSCQCTACGPAPNWTALGSSAQRYVITTSRRQTDGCPAALLPRRRCHAGRCHMCGGHLSFRDSHLSVDALVSRVFEVVWGLSKVWKTLNKISVDVSEVSRREGGAILQRMSY